MELPITSQTTTTTPSRQPLLRKIDGSEREHSHRSASRSSRPSTPYLVLSFFCITALAWVLFVETANSTTAVLTATTTALASSFSSFLLFWHIKPIKPYHHGRVVYSVLSDDAGRIIYKREFTVPCADGLLVFNVGPAPEYAPYAYDVYEDAYAYSDNSGLCIFYPSWQGLQQSYHKLWETKDLTAYTVNLGDKPNKISTRVVRPAGTKKDPAVKGGDYVIMRPGDFYTPAYYKRLKDEVNSWSFGEDVESRLEEFVQREQLKTEEAIVVAL